MMGRYLQVLHIPLLALGLQGFHHNHTLIVISTSMMEILASGF